MATDHRSSLIDAIHGCMDRNGNQGRKTEVLCQLGQKRFCTQQLHIRVQNSCGDIGQVWLWTFSSTNICRFDYMTRNSVPVFRENRVCCLDFTLTMPLKLFRNESFFNCTSLGSNFSIHFMVLIP